MSVAYFDSSALLKHYVTEMGSRWVQTYLSTISPYGVFTSCLTTVEVACAFARRLREGVLTAAAYGTVESAFEYDIRHKYNLLDVNWVTLDMARQLSKRHPLRAYDAVHLAAAHLANQKLIEAEKPPLVFVCADSRLAAIAEAEGLPVENPNHHP